MGKAQKGLLHIGRLKDDQRPYKNKNRTERIDYRVFSWSLTHHSSFSSIKLNLISMVNRVYLWSQDSKGRSKRISASSGQPKLYGETLSQKQWNKTTKKFPNIIFLQISPFYSPHFIFTWYFLCLVNYYCNVTSSKVLLHYNLLDRFTMESKYIFIVWLEKATILISFVMTLFNP